MSTYKSRNKQYIINSLKQPQYFFTNDYVVFNLNACFTKKDNYLKFLSNLKETREEAQKINLCNLASLCYKFDMNYASNETLDFVKTLKNYINQDTDFIITQDNIINCGECDLRPIDCLLSWDKKHNITYVNSVLLDCLKILGYVDNQLYNIIDFTKNLRNVIPEDLQEKLPIETKKNLGCYEMIKEILC